MENIKEQTYSKRKRARSCSPIRENNQINKFKISKKISNETKTNIKPKLSIEIEQYNLESSLEKINLSNIPSTPRNLHSKIKLARQNSMPK